MDQGSDENPSDEKLHETTVEERRRVAQLERAARQIHSRKFAAKTAVSIWDNLDAILGTIEKVFLLVIAELIRKGEWLNAGLMVVLAVVAWIIKIRRAAPGPIIAFFRKDPVAIRSRLVKIAAAMTFRKEI